MPLFKKERILRLDDQLLVDNTKMMWKVNQNLVPEYVMNLFKCSNQENRTRNMNVVNFVPRSTKVKNSFLCRPVINWQELDIDLKDYSNIKQFNTKMESSLFEKY